MLHCNLGVRWKVASDLRFWAAISEPETPSFCGISGSLAPSTRKSPAIVRSEKLQNKSSLNFSIFRPEFCPEFWPNFLRSFRASFRGKRRPEKIHQKSLAFFNAKSPGKFEEKIPLKKSGEQAK